MTDPHEAAEANPHPASSHRTPRQVAADERGPTRPRPAKTAPVRKAKPNERIDGEPRSDTARRSAVKRSAHRDTGSTELASAPEKPPARADGTDS